MSNDTPRIEVTIAAPADAVWDALRTKEKVRHWHGWEYDDGGGLDAEIDEIFFLQITEDAEAQTLRLRGGDVFRVEPDGDGATVTLTRAPHGADPDWEAYYDDVTEGWTTFLHQLKFALERHPDEPRQTLFFSGDTETSGSPLDSLDLAVVAGHEPGTPYDADLAGERVTGTVWFRSDNQLGLTVDGWATGWSSSAASRCPSSSRRAPHWRCSAPTASMTRRTTR